MMPTVTVQSIPLDLTFDEAAAMGHISHRTVRRLVRDGKLQAVRYNSKVVRITYDSWKAYREEPSTSQNLKVGRIPSECVTIPPFVV